MIGAMEMRYSSGEEPAKGDEVAHTRSGWTGEVVVVHTRSGTVTVRSYDMPVDLFLVGSPDAPTTRLWDGDPADLTLVRR